DKKKDSPTPPASSTQPLVQGLREWITALISFAIVVVALWMLIDTYTSGKVVAVEASGKAQLDAFARQKDLLLYALALLGTVTGYYLGRVPAELHAQRAESEAKASQQQAEAARNSEA